MTILYKAQAVNNHEVKILGKAWKMKLIWVLIPLLLSIMLTLGTETALAQPAITGVEVFNIAESSVTIKWFTEEPGDSVVHYGTDKDFGFAVSDSSLATDHVVDLTDLSPGTRYYLTVESTDDNDGKFYTFKTLKASVVRKTFVGTVVGNATSTSSLINSTSTVTLIRQGKGERITIALPDTYTLKTPGGPRAGTFGEGARVVIRATRIGGQWVAESVLVKPVRPNVPVIGVVIGLDETTMTVMTQNGLAHTFELADDADRPSKGEVLTVFQGISSKAKGLVRTEEVGRRLRAFLESAKNSESDFEADYLSELLEVHDARSIKIIDDVLPQAPDDAKVDISNAREKIRGATHAAEAANKGNDSGHGQQANDSQKPTVPPGLSDKGGSKGNSDDKPGKGSDTPNPDGNADGGDTNQTPGKGQGSGKQSNPNDDDKQEGDSKGRGSEKQNPGKGPPNPNGDADEGGGDENQKHGKGRGSGEQPGSSDNDEQKGRGKKGKGSEK